MRDEWIWETDDMGSNIFILFNHIYFKSNGHIDTSSVDYITIIYSVFCSCVNNTLLQTIKFDVLICSHGAAQLNEHPRKVLERSFVFGGEIS